MLQVNFVYIFITWSNICFGNRSEKKKCAKRKHLKSENTTWNYNYNFGIYSQTMISIHIPEMIFTFSRHEYIATSGVMHIFKTRIYCNIWCYAHLFFLSRKGSLTQTFLSLAFLLITLKCFYNI